MHFIKNVELKFQPQFVFNSCFGFRAKFQNNKVTEISRFCNHENLNNVSNCFVNNDFVEFSSYNSVMSVAKRPNVSTALGQQSDHIQSKVEISTTPLPAPSLLFEASGRFFGVVYNDVSQETFCDSSTGCATVSSIEGASNVAILQNSTSKMKVSKMKHFKMLELQKLKMQTCKKIELHKVHRAPQMCLSLDNSTMTIHILLLLLLLKILTKRGLV